jgi:hypothetical protein
MVSAPLPLLAITGIGSQLTQLALGGGSAMPNADQAGELPIGKILDAFVAPREPAAKDGGPRLPQGTVQLNLPQGSITLKPPPQLQQFLTPGTPVEIKLERTPQGVAARLINVASVPVEKLMEAATSKGTPPAIIAQGEVEIPLPGSSTAQPYNKLKPAIPLDMPLPGGVKPAMVTPAQLTDIDGPQQQAWEQFAQKAARLTLPLPQAAPTQALQGLPATLTPGMQLLMRVFFIPAPNQTPITAPVIPTTAAPTGTAAPALPGQAMAGQPVLPGFAQPGLATGLPPVMPPAAGVTSSAPNAAPASAAMAGQTALTPPSAAPATVATPPALTGSPTMPPSLPQGQAMVASGLQPGAAMATGAVATAPAAPAASNIPATLPSNLWPAVPAAGATPAAAPPVSSVAAPLAAIPLPGSVAATGMATSITTPIGNWQTMPLPPVPPGTAMAVEFMPLPAAGVGAASSLPLPQEADAGWPALHHAVQLLQKLESPASAHFLQHRLPQISARLLPATLFFLQALGGKSAEDWLGKEVMQMLQQQDPELALQLGKDVGTLQTQWQQSADQTWQSTILPLWFQEDIEPVSLYLRKQSKKAENGMEGHRFMVDLNLSYFGPMQLDGFYKQWAQGAELPSHEQNHKQFSLTIRTQRVLESDVSEGIRHLFYTSMEAMRLQGTLSIRHDEPFVVAESPPGGLFSVLKAFSG